MANLNPKTSDSLTPLILCTILSSKVRRCGISRKIPGWVVLYVLLFREVEGYDTDACFSRQICCQNVSEMVHRAKIKSRIVLKTYSRDLILRDVPYMAYFHNKLFVLNYHSLKSLTILHREHNIDRAIDDLDTCDIGITCRGDLERLKEVVIKDALDATLWHNNAT